jgi:hypothetical protein
MTNIRFIFVPAEFFYGFLHRHIAKTLEFAAWRPAFMLQLDELSPHMLGRDKLNDPWDKRSVIDNPHLGTTPSPFNELPL